MEFLSSVLLIVAFLAALLIAYFQYFYKSKEKSQYIYWLFFIRFSVLFSIFLLFINPSLKKMNIEIVKPNLVVAIDNSSSIKYNKLSETVENLVALLKKNTDLNEKFDIKYFSFGSKVNILDSLAFNEPKTNLAEPLIEFSKIVAEKVSPTILISDGNQTIGNNIAYTNYKNPVFAYVVGDTTSSEDLYIHQINVNKFSYINNKFPVEVFVNYNGGNKVSKQLSVFYKGKSIYTKQLEFSSKENAQVDSFFLEAKEEGNQYYTVKIEALKNEVNSFNNSKTISVNVLKEQSKIAVISSIIHPDLGLLKKAIESNKQRSVTFLDPANLKNELSNFQLVVLYQPNNSFKTIIQQLKAKSIHYLIVTGTKTDWNFLNNNQQVFSKKAIAQTENFSPVLNMDYSSFQLKDIGFSNFAPLEDLFGAVKFNAPFNTLLFQKIGNFNTENPLLATFDDNGQKGGVLLGEGIWRWRMNSYSVNKSFEPFDGFMANLIQFLGSNKSMNRLQVTAEALYYSNETILFSANYLDANYNFDSRAKLWLTVSNKATNFSNKIPLSVGSHGFYTELNKLPSGDYNYSVRVENQTDTVAGTFTILPFEIEQQYSNSTDEQLKLVAQNTGGALFYEQQEDALISKLLEENVFKSIQKSTIEKTPLIDWKWLLGFIILLLSIEWFTRKYFGKI